MRFLNSFFVTALFFSSSINADTGEKGWLVNDTLFECHITDRSAEREISTTYTVDGFQEHQLADGIHSVLLNNESQLKHMAITVQNDDRGMRVAGTYFWGENASLVAESVWVSVYCQMTQ